MINVCRNCGSYRPDKRVDASGPHAICPDCGHRHRFIMGPLLIVSGASGAGKTSVCALLTGVVTRAVLLDSDILWRPELADPASNHRDFFETWLRVAKNIAQSGRPVVLFGAGFGVPDNIEPCIERRYFSTVHYLALTCADEQLGDRLRARPAWRGAGKGTFIGDQLRFNAWFRSCRGSPPIELIDTTDVAPEQTADRVDAWIRQRVPAP
jgi:predicted kinase